MDTWLVVSLVALGAITVLALVRRRSGRPRGRSIPSNRGTADQRFAGDSNRIATMRTRDGLGGGTGPLS